MPSASEVSDTTLAYDREVKLPLYASSGIEEVWIVDVNARRIEQYTHPEAGLYRQVRIFVGGDAIRPWRVRDVSLIVEALFE
jgi:Uma2 family endonuclease